MSGDSFLGIYYIAHNILQVKGENNNEITPKLFYFNV